MKIKKQLKSLVIQSLKFPLFNQIREQNSSVGSLVKAASNGLE
jgi:hypothetical protein